MEYLSEWQKDFFSRSAMDSKPLFEVKLDPGNMSIVNTAEIIDIFQKSNYGVCSTGKCSKRNNLINCKCINKKIIPKTMECTEKTCNSGRKYNNLSYLCSRVFSRCENWNRPDTETTEHRYRNNRRPTKEVNVKNEKVKEKSSPAIRRRNGLHINLSKDRNQKHRDAVITKQRLHMSEVISVGKNDKKDKKKKSKKEKNINVRYKPSASYLQNFLVRCLKRKRKRCKKKMKEEEMALEKAEKRAIKEDRKTLRKQQNLWKQEEEHWNCLTKFIAGLVNLIINTIKTLISAIFSLIFSPVRTFVFIKRRIKDPNGTIGKLSNWFQRTWGNRSSKISGKIKDIGALNIIADHFEDTRVYDALFADRGQTKEERALYEARKRKRKQRMNQRDNEARFGCRHILLTTLRKTPCLWCYFLCPELYPACLSLINFMKNFFNVMLYLLAFIFWTPCIISFEVCRAFLCCFFCTG
ncbi:uncharacterized protein [Maniola hyperantus]|uniref:uncharacterized protein n=1 Tax=Aphantopus hyperantus TaxID=2795564 RepID=UPI00374A2E0F